MKIFVRVKANAKKAEVEEIDATHFRVAVTATPVDGKANQAVRKALAKHLGVAPTRLVLKSGVSSRDKVFEVDESSR